MTAPDAVVYVVEDDASFRKSIERLIRASGWTVVSYASAEAFLQQADIRRPACLLLDVRLPDTDGLRLQARLAKMGVDVPIVFMTGHGNIPMGVEAMKRGAVDFLPKPFATGDLLRAIGEAVDRDAVNLTTVSQRERAVAALETLTPREGEILRWVITGRLNKQIAQDIGIAEATVKIHRARVMQKTGVSSVAELVRLAALAGVQPAE